MTNLKSFTKDIALNLKEGYLNTMQEKPNQVKAFIPWRLVYYEVLRSKSEAIKREKYFKSAAVRRYLQGKIKL